MGMEASTPPLATAKAEVTKPKVMEGPNHAWRHNERVISEWDYSPAIHQEISINQRVGQEERSIGHTGLWWSCWMLNGNESPKARTQHDTL